MKLGEVLRAYRVSTLRHLSGNPKVLSLESLAAEIGISKATLSRIERGKMCDAITLVRILEWLMGAGIVRTEKR